LKLLDQRTRTKQRHKVAREVEDARTQGRRYGPHEDKDVDVDVADVSLTRRTRTRATRDLEW